MHHPGDVRPRLVDLRVYGPLPHIARLVGTVESLSFEIDNDQVSRLERTPTDRTGFNQNAVLVQARAQMTGETVAGGSDGIENLAPGYQILANHGFASCPGCSCPL